LRIVAGWRRFAFFRLARRQRRFVQGLAFLLSDPAGFPRCICQFDLLGSDLSCDRMLLGTLLSPSTISEEQPSSHLIACLSVPGMIDLDYSHLSQPVSRSESLAKNSGSPIHFGGFANFSNSRSTLSCWSVWIEPGRFSLTTPIASAAPSPWEIQICR
jgi:hypothetical protein